MKFQFNDGGRSAAGYHGEAGDCVTRAIAIATEKPYQEIYDALNKLGASERTGKRKRGRSNARTGVYRVAYEKYLESLGYEWTPTMQIGQGCKIHLRADELPKGRLVVSVSKHLTAMINGVIHDTHDPSRDGTRCVYGYYVKEHRAKEEVTQSCQLQTTFTLVDMERFAAEAWGDLGLNVVTKWADFNEAYLIKSCGRYRSSSPQTLPYGKSIGDCLSGEHVSPGEGSGSICPVAMIVSSPTTTRSCTR